LAITSAGASRLGASGVKADGGVVVTAADPNGVAADHGFILDVSGKSVASPADVRTQIADARKEGKHTLLFRVKSNAGTRFVALPLGNA
jgi:serine protease Do